MVRLRHNLYRYLLQTFTMFKNTTKFSYGLIWHNTTHHIQTLEEFMKWIIVQNIFMLHVNSFHYSINFCDFITYHTLFFYNIYHALLKKLWYYLSKCLIQFPVESMSFLSPTISLIVYTYTHITKQKYTTTRRCKIFNSNEIKGRKIPISLSTTVNMGK